MPKTKDAYALRNFDETKILQRLWFKDFNLPVGDDENVLLYFYNIVEKPIEDVIFNGSPEMITHMEENYPKNANENLEIVAQLGDRTVFYEALLERHMIRLNGIKKYYVEKFMATENKIWKTKALRATELIKRYHEILNSITALREKISIKVKMLKELFEKDFRQLVFGSRLRQARKAAGLTQRELAERVGFKTYNSIAQYERGLNDPSLPTLFRIATELNCSADWLLNLK
ncbi:MAG: helix-turn-helix transcriptional regulator [Selenomonadaceae bacterium]|nr:helix-turn-helix transcriptional regulator [Selenomonadaceae bacterium]